MTFYPGLQIEAKKSLLVFPMVRVYLDRRRRFEGWKISDTLWRTKIVTDLKNCMLLSWILGMKRTEFP